MGFWSDFFSGDFSASLNDLAAEISNLPDWLKNLIGVVETDAGKLLASAAQQEAQNIITNGLPLTTATFTSSAKTIGDNLEAQGIQMGTQIIFTALNGAVSALNPAPATAPATSEVPTPPAAA